VWWQSVDCSVQKKAPIVTCMEEWSTSDRLKLRQTDRWSVQIFINYFIVAKLSSAQQRSYYEVAKLPSCQYEWLRKVTFSLSRKT
jgi:hypothetical protein